MAIGPGEQGGGTGIGGGIGLLLGMIIGHGRQPWQYRSGQTYNYADSDYRYIAGRALHDQASRSPHGVYISGINRDAQLAGRAAQNRSGKPGMTRRTYMLGAPSQEFWDKYSKWGQEGPQQNEGWKNTLTNAPPSQSTFAPTRKFDEEVFMTRETRNKGGIQPFQTLNKHPNTSRLNPNLAYMYKEKNTQLGAVRRRK